MNKTIYTFWLGDEKRKQELIRYHEELNKIIAPWKFELGPTPEEHEFFMKKFKYYKRAYKKGIYSFCSDIYRFYKIYQNGGLYIDSGVKYNKEKIKDFLNRLDDLNYLFVYETSCYIWSGMFYVKEPKDQIIKKCLNYFHRNAIYDFYVLPVAPTVISHYVFKKLSYFPEDLEGCECLKSCELDSNNKDNILYMGCTGSWHINKNDSNHAELVIEGWKKAYQTFDEDKNTPRKILVKKKKKRINFYKTAYINFLWNRILRCKYTKKIYEILRRLIKGK